MRKKIVRNALREDNPLNALYNKMTPKQRADFVRFAQCFGWSKEGIKKVLSDERNGLHHRGS